MYFQDITGYYDNKKKSVIVYDKITFIMCKNINMCFLSASEREISQNCFGREKIKWQR